MPAPSARLNKIPPYLFAEIARIKREAIASGADIIDLGIGDPDVPTPDAVIEALCQSAKDPATHRYDESANGWPDFLKAGAEFLSREFGVLVDPEKEMAQVIGSKEGLAHLAWAYLDEGDYAIVPNPGYPVYRINAQMAGGEVFDTPLNEGNNYLPDLSAIPTEVAKKAKLFYVCYPGNPTSKPATAEFYRDLVAFCRDHDILAVGDMAYANVAYDGGKHVTLLQQPGAKEVAIEFHSLSKIFNMTGWRLGFVAGNPDAVATLQKLKSNIDSKQFPAIAEAGAYALRHVNNQATIDLYQKRRDILVSGLRELGWNVPSPSGALYVWAPVPRPDLTSAEFAGAMLKEAHIVAIPGTGYGSEGEGYVRMSLTLAGDKDGERFHEVVRRIGESGILGG
ncbi:MAG: aminotransferase class I/II-fold pyridoxal phosphate-dependent enzyme [Fimbriimonadaceae bacterium]|nr:aminotransferase class I/II-fold pyridoxal phosphate-dependent enzyme [Fimbriimonadaceae bacterium]